MSKRTRNDTIVELNEQIQALKFSCANYDSGNFWEAKRIASIVYMLVHDRGRSVSILRQLGIRSSLKFVSTGKPFENNVNGVVSFNILPFNLSVATIHGAENIKDTKVFWDPHCKKENVDIYSHLKFEHWWKQPIYRRYLKPHLGVKSPKSHIDRQGLTVFLRNQDGGAHYDPHVTNLDYIEMRSSHPVVSFCYTDETGDHDIPSINGHYASMRQIGWEILETVKQIDLTLLSQLPE